VIFGVGGMFTSIATENVWVDFDSQVVVIRQTYLFPVPNTEQRLAFSDIDHIRYDFNKGRDNGWVFLVKRDGVEFDIHYCFFPASAGRRVAQELAGATEKPLEEVVR